MLHDLFLLNWWFFVGGITLLLALRMLLYIIEAILCKQHVGKIFLYPQGRFILNWLYLKKSIGKTILGSIALIAFASLWQISILTKGDLESFWLSAGIFLFFPISDIIILGKRIVYHLLYLKGNITKEIKFSRRDELLYSCTEYLGFIFITLLCYFVTNSKFLLGGTITFISLLIFGVWKLWWGKEGSNLNRWPKG